jgi:hypothetical protein
MYVYKMYVGTQSAVCGIYTIYETITAIARPSPDEQKGPKLREHNIILYLEYISRAGVTIITIIIITFRQCHYVIRTRYHRYF